MKIDIEKQKIRRCFNKAANTYDEHCFLQREIGESTISLLKNNVDQVSSMLDLGCGTGIITEKLVNAIKHDRCYAMDISDALIARAQQRIPLKQAQIFIGDFDKIPLKDTSQDVAFSSMAIQWSLDVKKTFQEIRRVLKNEKYFVFSVPIQGTFQELIAAIEKANLPLSYNHFQSINFWEANLKEAGFRIKSIKEVAHTYYYDSIFDLLKSIKNVGAMHVKNAYHRSTASKRYFEKIESFYHKDNVQSKFPLTYNIAQHFVIKESI
ncbi:MAG: malonyl-ACP O-methyltransferase BioC [Gammaproteobacteria bacterium]